MAISCPNRIDGRAVRSARYKYITYFDSPTVQLFDMVADPHETRNLAPEEGMQKIVKEHQKMLVKWESSLTHADRMRAAQDDGE